MEINAHYDIVVVGAGPAGAMAATYAQKFGARVLVLERSKSAQIPVRCAEGVYLKSLEREFCIPSIAIASKIDKLRLHSSPTSSVLFTKLGKGLILNRHIMEEWLIAKAMRRGAHFIRGAEAIEILHCENEIRGLLVRNHAETYTVNCKVIIAADGIESRLAQKAGLDSRLSTHDMESSYQYLVEMDNVPADTLQIFHSTEFAPGGYAWLFPKGTTTANIGLAICADQKHGLCARDFCLRFLKYHFPQAKIIAEVGGGIPVSKGMKELSRNGFMVAGDAARLVNPLTGGGIHSALYSGKQAGLVAAEAVFYNDVSSCFLSKYDRLVKAKYYSVHEVMYSLAQRAKKMQAKRADEIVQIMLKIPQNQRRASLFFLYLLKKKPLSFFKLLYGMGVN